MLRPRAGLSVLTAEVDFDLVCLQQGPPDGGEVAQVTFDFLLQVEGPDVLVQRAHKVGCVGAVLVLVPLWGAPTPCTLHPGAIQGKEGIKFCSAA